MVEEKINLWFQVPFNKGVVGVENDAYTSEFRPECKDCEKDLSEGELYYWTFDQIDLSSEWEDEFCLCEACAKNGETMTLCGIKKYDKLPARVGWIDVDYLRWRIFRYVNPSFLNNVPFLRWFIPHDNSESMKRIIYRLDEAAEMWKQADLMDKHMDDWRKNNGRCD